jgi:hypothetical protein
VVRSGGAGLGDPAHSGMAGIAKTAMWRSGSGVDQSG